MKQSYIKELLYYDEATGDFYWQVARRGASKKRKAGTKTKVGYVQIMIDGKYYLAHRLAWLYMNGKFPKLHIDHMNGNKSDNSIKNLREVSIALNQQNYTKANKNNKANLLGAFYSESRQKWFSKISLNNKRKYLGTFQTALEAHKAYIQAKREMHPNCTI